MREMDEELLVYKKKQEEKTEEILSEVRGQKTFEEFEEGSDDALRTVYSPEELELREKMSGKSNTKKGAPGKDAPFIMPAMGLEPIRCCHRQILSLVRLPIPPRRHSMCQTQRV